MTQPQYTPEDHVYYTGLFEQAATYHRVEWMRLINRERLDGQREYNASSQDATSSHASGS